MFFILRVMRFGWRFLLSFLLLFLWVSLYDTHAQNFSKIDSLRSLLSNKSGVEKFNVLNAIGFEYRLSFPDSTIYYCTQAYDLGRSIALKKDLSRPLSFIGLANHYKGNYKASLDFHLQSVEVAQEQEDSLQLGYSYNNFGRLLFDQGDMSRAYENLIKSQRIFERKKDATGEAYVYRSLANLFKSQGDYQKALQMARKAYELRSQLGDQRALFSALIELGAVHSEMNNSDMANSCFEKADSIATRIRDQISLAEMRISWAEFLIRQNDLEKANELAHKAYSFVNDAQNLRLLPRATLLRGVVHFRLGEYEEAKEFLKNVIESTGQSNLNLQRDAYLYISKVYEKEDRHDDANFAFARYLSLKDSLQSIELVRNIEKLQFQLEIEKNERENENLKANDAAIIRHQQLQNIILIVVIVFITVLLFIQRYNSRKRKKAIAQLAQQNLKIENQRKEIEDKNAKLEKRNRELSELSNEKDTLMNIVAHDLKSPLNRIHGLSDLISMEGSLNPNHLKYLDLVKDSTRSGLDLIVDLLDVNALEVNRTPNYSIFDLPATVKERVGAFQHYAATKSITLKLKNDFEDLIYLDRSYLIRILDNLISNAVKFSKVKSIVWIESEMRSGFCVVRVSDRGPGFGEADKKLMFQKFKKLSARPTAGESSNGLGLAIVKILVDRMGGMIELQSEVGKGSTFEIFFPMKTVVPV